MPNEEGGLDACGASSSTATVSAQPPRDHTTLTEESLFDGYRSLASTVRRWLIGYGVGFCALVLAQGAVLEAVRTSPAARSVGKAIVWGIVIQVALTLVHQSAMWALYYGKVNPAFQDRFWHHFADAVSENYWGELLAELATVGLYIWATLRFVSIVFPST
jgi:hypothetical protein